MRDYEALAAIEALDARPVTDTSRPRVRRAREEVALRKKYQDERNTLVLKILQRYVDDEQLCVIDSLAYSTLKKHAELVYQKRGNQLASLNQNLGEYLMRFYESEEQSNPELHLIATWTRANWLKLVSALRVELRVLDYAYMGFRNVVLDRTQQKFVNWSSVPETVSVCAYIDTDVPELEYSAFGMPLFELPILSKIMDTQQWDNETRYLYFAMLGRTWRGRKVDANDHLELLPMSIGQAGTGKTLTLQLIALGFHETKATTLNSDNDDNFKLSHVIDKDVILIDELNRRSSSIQNGTWWTIASKGSLAVRDLYKSARSVRFDMPLWMSGLGTMKLMDKGDYDSFRRRVVPFPFYRKPESVDRNILTDIIDTGEIGHIMAISELCYQHLLTHPMVLPKQMLALMETVAGDLNPLYIFYRSCLIDTHATSPCPIQTVKAEDLQKAYELFAETHDIVRTSKYIWGERSTDCLRDDAFWRRALREVYPHMFIDRIENPGIHKRAALVAVYHCKLIPMEDIKDVILSDYCELEGDTRAGTSEQVQTEAPPWVVALTDIEQEQSQEDPQNTSMAFLSQAVDNQLVFDNTQ